MKRTFKKYAGYSLAIAAGLVTFTFVASSMATPTTICYRGRTVTVDSSVVPQYVAVGATVGACGTSAP